MLILAIGALARGLALPLPGTGDVLDWKKTAFVGSSDFLNIYGRGGWPPEQRRLVWGNASVTTEYPPISQMEMALVGKLYRQIDPGFSDSGTLNALIKLPGLLAEIGFVVALLTWGRRVLGETASRWAACVFWINPSIWLCGSALGYLDAQMAVPAALALLAAADNRPRLAGALAAIAVLTKPQAIFMLPALALILVNSARPPSWKAAMSAAIAATAVAIAAVAPFVLAGTWPSLLRATQRLAEHDLISGNATNFWWLVTWAAGSAERFAELGLERALTRPATMVRISKVMSMGLPNPRTIGTVLTLAVIGWGVWRARHAGSRPIGFLVGAWCVVAYFMFSGQVHENHTYLAIPLLTLAAAELPRLRPVYWAVTAVFALNVYVFYGLGDTVPPLLDRRWTFVDLTVLLAIAYSVVFVWLTREMIAATKPAAHIAPSGDVRGG